ncbi:MAG: hypothetical protein OEW77_03945 [Gemmatimonadota bacterium]|nr:hypothetical protein [Gemmatimonadota bacterium]
MRPASFAVLFAVLLGLTGHELLAQVAPDAPRLISPRGSGGLGVHWVRSDALPGAGPAVLVTWATPGLPDGVRFRGGVGQGAATTNAFFGGLDLQAPLRRAPAAGGVDVDWQSGFGVSIGEYTLLTLPVGLTGGVSWTSGSLWLAPYVTGGVAADMRLGGGAPAREFVVATVIDVGLDLSLDEDREFVLRLAAGLGDRRAVSFGLAYRMGRLAR